ncbi:MAG: DEAD/DEAH box helicase [Synechococcales bacterium]|nr:DEAD/DEAH box helicase [Synechococcales bacterium]
MPPQPMEPDDRPIALPSLNDVNAQQTDSPISTLDLTALFPFDLDDFQKQAIAALNEGRSVVVCAPTGSGKTLIGEYAIYRALAHGKRVFYTTPLKALSNQKLRDFRDRFGSDKVGLLTGDTSVNRDAPVLVMTTEIFRNMLYGTPIGEVGTSVQDVEAVVLDECHYMNDRQRGTVWEEAIIYAPHTIQLVALSATVANSEQLTDWIDKVHGPTDRIYSDYRPVPLQFHFCKTSGLFPLLNARGTGMNSRLKGKGRQRGRPKAPSIAFVVSQLKQYDMLPAIYFIFSRRGCDQALDELGHFSLVDEVEAAALKRQIDDFLAHNPEAARTGQVEALYRGIAAHHAGILPAWKGLVEELFQQGLIKVVFATETLAAGINMPARTTVISSLSKRTDRGHRLLTASEFLQMAGRAGRRGMDELGHVVTVQTRFEGASEAAFLATSDADPLISQFTPSYGMVLNLLQTHSLEEARSLIERSFGQYLATLHLAPQQAAIARLEAEHDHHQAQVAHVTDVALLREYDKLAGRLKEEQRLLKYLKQQAQEVAAEDLALIMPFAISGTLMCIKGKHIPNTKLLPAVLVAKVAGTEESPYLVVLGQDNGWYVVTTANVVKLFPEIPRLVEADTLTPPPDLPPKPGQARLGDETSLAIAQKIPQFTPATLYAPEVQTQMRVVDELEAALTRHPAHQWGNPTQMLKQLRRLKKVEEELRDRQEKLGEHTQHYWQQFLNLIAVLRHFDCLDGVQPTRKGQIAAAIRGDNELWLGLAIASGELDDLAPHHLAAVCAALCTEISRPDTWSSYDPSPEVELALSSLRGLRRQVFQLQRRYQIALPVWMEYDVTGVVEQWALGIDWTTLVSHTSLDEGDIVRVLRRTLDFLSQLPHVPHIADSLRQNVYRAVYLIDRFPVNERLNDLEDSTDAEEPEESDTEESDTDEADPEEIGLEDAGRETTADEEE